MRVDLSLAMTLLVVYQVKHFLADYPLQTGYMLGKFSPGWGFFWPLLAHAAVHGAMTLFITMAVTHDNWLALSLGAFDTSVHFAMDRLKAGPRYMGRWKPISAAEYLECQEMLAGDCNSIEYVNLRRGGSTNNPRIVASERLRDNKLFWWALGIDQKVHHLTHYACITLILLRVS